MKSKERIFNILVTLLLLLVSAITYFIVAILKDTFLWLIWTISCFGIGYFGIEQIKEWTEYLNKKNK